VTRKVVTVAWTGEGLLFDGLTEHGSARLAGDTDGAGSGPTPAEALLLAVGGCTGMDVVSILRKMRQPLQAFRVEVVGDRAAEHPRRYTALEVVYHLVGDLDESKVRRAIELSEQRYCSVEATVRDCVPISSRYIIERPETGREAQA